MNWMTDGGWGGEASRDLMSISQDLGLDSEGSAGKRMRKAVGRGYLAELAEGRNRVTCTCSAMALECQS